VAAGPGTEEVQLTTIDVFAKRHSLPKIDVLKIDAEGNDNKVMIGASRAIVNTVGLFTFEGGGGVTFSKGMIEELDALGYSCYSTSRAGLFKWNSGCMDEKYMGGFAAKDKGNVFCAHRERAPTMTLAFDAMSFPMLITQHAENTKNLKAAGKQEFDLDTLDIKELSEVYLNVKPFCSPFPACAYSLLNI